MPGTTGFEGHAHDCNNLLQVALCLAETLEARLATDALGLRKLDDLQRVLADLKALNHPGRHAGPGPATDLVLPSAPDEVLARSVCLARTFAGAGIRFEVHLGAAGARVPVPGIRLQQILFNLLKNAVEAVPPGTGRVLVESFILQGEDPSHPQAQVVQINLTDNGPGIAPEIQSRLFEAGATSKAGGRGLGLHHSRQLVRRYGGAIALAGGPGSGTRATLTWPAWTPPPEPVPDFAAEADAQEPSRQP